MSDHTRGPKSVVEHEGHDDRATIEEAGGSATAVGEVATGTEDGKFGKVHP